MIKVFRPFIILAGLLFVWQMLVYITEAPPYILPDPLAVFEALFQRLDTLISHAGITFLEIILGFLIGSLLGCCSALILTTVKSARDWLTPILVITQSLPVFALAPILVLWLGYGLPSKVAMAVLIIYFPVTAAFYDGLRRTPKDWQALAQVMGAKPLAFLLHVRIPLALPSLSSGLRVAMATAPIGAIVGEWVGSSEGLGYLMLHANGRMQIDLMFAALLILSIMAVSLYLITDHLLHRLLQYLSLDDHKTR
ncbi:ABC transporter permease [Kiloniella spongiae]|uniref:ABC transporter permease n=1 Tax=Kiloniella spongiae TaxID=1489064 RepID=A0A0H2MAV1_9PROT|nr:ABC transporter permease [Kiloniella spongiae]KLN59311.1 ABC transporter permease [Kiloniella spongiae]